MSESVASIFRVRIPITAILFSIWFVANSWSQTKDDRRLLAGIYAKNINPEVFPVWVNGGIAASTADRVNDPLHARCLVLGDGSQQVAICIVDNCILPIELVDAARAITSTRTRIPPENILIAATHAHSAVSVAGVHGTPVQEDYAAKLPTWIAEGIEEAQRRMVPARWGTSSVVCDKYIYCRRWMMKPGTATNVPFTGRESNQVNMNPGYENLNKLAPVGPVDTLVPILSIQTRDGKPLAVLSSFSTHYAGAKALSADYFAVVCNELAKALRPEEPSAFMGLMANATSGDANCIDFSKPREPFTHVDVGRYVAERILTAIPEIQYSDKVDLATAFETLTVAARMPTAEEVAEAKKYIATHFPDRLPKTSPENYARETVLLAELPPTRDLRLQVIRLGHFAIVANPCESYGETGLKIRQASPFALTMNIGLANGHGGYIPPPAHFQLGGYTTWRARSSCLEEQAEPKMVERLSSLLQSLKPRKSPDKDVTRLESGQGSGGMRAQDKPHSPVPAEESLRWLHVEPGYRVRLVAAEPQVVDPVAMQIDEEHRMWVVEMRDYPMGDPEQGLGRVVVLQDENRDGRYERATTFASGLRFPTGIQLWKGGAFVTAAGELLYLKDENRDLIADSQETVLKGFSIGNPQLRANHPTIGMDGWLYVANGLKGGKVDLPSSHPSSEAIDMTNRDLRLHLKEGRIEAITGPSQFGLTMDAWGHRYGCSNRRPCIEMMVEQSDISRSPLAGLVPPIIDSLPAEAQSTVRPLVDAWTTSNLHAGQFTAACGVLVSHSRHLPSSAYGHAFACEPTGSLVQRRAIQRPRGQTLVADESPQREWLASEDPWFRPVNLIEGPQGAIYVADMYRAVIEHPEWVPEELKKRPDERFGDQQGRIYCVERNDSSEPADAKSKEPDWSIATIDDLVSALESPDAWCRQTATRRLLEKEDATAIPLLSQLATKSKAPTARIHAAHLLGYWQKLDPDTAIHLVQDPDPRVRGTAWRLLPQSVNLSGSEGHAAAIKSLTSADVDEVRSVCWYLAKASSESTFPWEGDLVRTCAQRAAKDPGDGYSLMAYTAACSRQLGPFLTEWTRELEERLGHPISGSAEKDERLPEIALQAITRLAQRLEDKEQLALRQQIHRYSQQDSESLRSGDRLASLQRAMGLSLLEGFCLSDKKRVGVSSPNESQWIIALSGPSHSDASARVHALRLLRYVPTVQAAPILLTTLAHGSVSECRAALSAASYHRTSEIDQWLLTNFVGGAPDLRVETFGAIRNVSERLEELIHRLETNQIPLRSLDASMRQQLQSSGNAQQKKRVQSILAKANDPNREKVIQEYAQRLEKKGDLAQGRALFMKNCAPCHRVHDQGFAVGPDISDTRTQSYEKLLVSILDPNRSIDASFLRYVALMEDGEVVDGLLRDSNSETITLRGQNGRDTTIARNLISELKSTGVSMMPEGMEQQITVQQMSDLLYYLKNWRYPLSNVPAEAIAK